MAASSGPTGAMERQQQKQLGQERMQRVHDAGRQPPGCSKSIATVSSTHRLGICWTEAGGCLEG